MRSLLFCFLVMALAGPASSQTTTDWKSMGLRGKVKELTIQQNYRYKKDGIAFTPWEKQYTSIYKFEPTGRYSEFSQLLANGSLNYRIRYSYNITEKKGEQAYYDKEDKPTIKKALLYDNKGKMIELVEYTKEGNRRSSYKYVYDAAGNNTELVYFREDGTMGSKTLWTYDAKGNVTANSIETPGYATSYKRYTYDSKGNRTEETWLDGNMQVTFRFVRSYDEKGNVTEEIKYKGDNNPRDKTTWKYEYDNQGNWIKKTQYASDGTDFNIEERTIIYY